MLKKCFALLLTLGLLLTVLPSAAFAAGEVELNVYGFTKDSEEVVVFAKNVVAGDTYMIALNGNENQAIAIGQFPKDGENVLKFAKKDHPLLSDLRRGDVLNVRVASANFSLKKQIEVTYDGFNAAPEKMELVTTSLDAKDTRQNLKIRFDEYYRPSSNDQLRLVAYDKEGNRMGREYSQVFKINDSNLTRYRYDRYREATFSVRPDEKVAYYQVEFLSGQNIIASLTKKLPVNPPASALAELVVKYPSASVKIGQTVKPEMYFRAKNGDRVNVNNATFVFVGNAIEKSDRRTGELTLKNDKAYIGGEVKVTVAANGFTKTETLKVVSDVEGSVVTNTQVILNIGSTDMMVNRSVKKIDAPALIRNDRTYIPLRAVAEAFGSKVDFNNDTQSISITQGNKVIVMKVGSKYFTVNGKSQTMDVAPYIVKDAARTMVPIRFIGEALGYKVTPTYRNKLVASVLISNY